MAASSQAEAQFSQVLQCPICLETFTRPKVLHCGHTYCASCLQSHINNKVTHSRLTQACFPCPVCRTDTLLSDPNICIEQWAESLPVNSIVSSLIDVSSGRKEVHHCDQCIKQGKDFLATYFCKDCAQSMCMSCKQYHDGFPALGLHNVISVSDGSDSCFVTPDMSSIEACHKHSKKRIEFFCSDHETLCCNTCVILEHRKCERVLTVDDMLKSCDVKKKSNEIEANMAMFENHLKQITRKIKENSDTIQKDKADILQHIHSLKAQVIAKLQKLEDDVIAALESSYKSESFNLQTQDIDGHTLITAIGNDRTQLDLVMTHGSEVQKVIMLHNLDQNQSRYLRAITEYQKDIKDVRISLDVDTNLPIYVNNLSEIGKINILCEHLDFCSPCLAFETKVKPAAEIVPVINPLKERKGVKVSEFKVRVSSDVNVCHISHILHLRDARMLMVDCDNYKLKLFGQNHKCQESTKFQGQPWSACLLSDIEVAVSIPYQKTIQIIEIEDKMRKKREIATRFECWGIALVKDQLVITTSGYIILILDMDGNEINTVRTVMSHREKQLKPIFIKADTTNSAIYISYDTAHKLVAYSMTWDILFTYTNQDLTNSSGIDTDTEGNVYLCGYTSHCVYQISSEGKIIKTLLSKKEEKKKPLSITFYTDTDRFILTYGGCDVVEEYELQCSQK